MKIFSDVEEEYKKKQHGGHVWNMWKKRGQPKGENNGNAENCNTTDEKAKTL